MDSGSSQVQDKNDLAHLGQGVKGTMLVAARDGLQRWHVGSPRERHAASLFRLLSKDLVRCEDILDGPSLKSFFLPKPPLADGSSTGMGP